MSEDAYSICRYVQHYARKNGSAPLRDTLGCSSEFVDLLEKNGVVQLFALYLGGPKLYVVLTDKGVRMAESRR